MKPNENMRVKIPTRNKVERMIKYHENMMEIVTTSNLGQESPKNKALQQLCANVIKELKVINKMRG